MGRFISKRDKEVAEAIGREQMLRKVLDQESDAEILSSAIHELSQLRSKKEQAKQAVANFECALHHDEGLPAPMESAARVVIEVTAAFVLDENSESLAEHRFRDKPSYLVICPGCAEAYKIIENLTDTLEG